MEILPTDHVAGFLEIGRNEDGEVVVNHADISTDENGVGHIVFSSNQARQFADLLYKHSLAPHALTLMEYHLKKAVKEYQDRIRTAADDSEAQEIVVEFVRAIHAVSHTGTGIIVNQNGERV